MDRSIRTVEDVFELLDGMFAPEADTFGTGSWWDGFYADRDKPIPFFVDKPDETLVSYLERGLLTPGRALDLGCGPGRNAIHLAAAGFTVDAVDLSERALAWAADRAREAGVEVRFHRGNAFGLDLGKYNLVYDSGCFHHQPPHRRVTYRAFLDRVLVPGGHFALTCFTPGGEESGSQLPDAEFYRTARLHGGLAYTEVSLRWIFSDLLEVEQRVMHDEPPESPYFGLDFLRSALFQKPAH